MGRVWHLFSFFCGAWRDVGMCLLVVVIFWHYLTLSGLKSMLKEATTAHAVATGTELNTTWISGVLDRPITRTNRREDARKLLSIPLVTGHSALWATLHQVESVRSGAGSYAEEFKWGEYSEWFLVGGWQTQFGRTVRF